MDRGVDRHMDRMIYRGREVAETGAAAGENSLRPRTPKTHILRPTKYMHFSLRPPKNFTHSNLRLPKITSYP